MNDLIERMRLLERDHEPDGWPAVQMRDITALLDALEAYRKRGGEPVALEPSDSISVVGMPEFDALMDHIYENGTASEGVLPLANALARAILAREAVRLNAQTNPSMDDIVHAAVICALDEASVRNDVLRGMCIEVALEKARDMLGGVKNDT